MTEILEHRGAFIQTLQAGPHVRERIFETLEKYYAQDFESGRMGRRLYDVLYSAVQDAGVPEAVQEFESRFLPLLNRSRSPRKGKSASAAITSEEGGAPRENRVRGWAAALCAVVLVVGGLAIGLVALNTFAPAPPTRTKSSVSRPPVADPIRTITEVKAGEVVHVDQDRASEQRTDEVRADP